MSFFPYLTVQTFGFGGHQPPCLNNVLTSLAIALAIGRGIFENTLRTKWFNDNSRKGMRLINRAPPIEILSTLST